MIDTSDGARHQIRAWRRHRGLSLRQLANRMEKEPGVQLISHASLGRIEKGEQPYSQPILEGLARALEVPIEMLLIGDPDREGDLIDLITRLDEDKREQARAILTALTKT